MGHDTFVYGCLGEPVFDQDGDVTNGQEIAYTRFGCGVPLRKFWYKILEATKFDNGCSGGEGPVSTAWGFSVTRPMAATHSSRSASLMAARK